MRFEKLAIKYEDFRKEGNKKRHNGGEVEGEKIGYGP